MGRPKKENAEYFPHFAADSKTRSILENRYGNDGYAFWFKLLELLCKSDGHIYDCSKVLDWEYLVDYTKVSTEKIENILDLLSAMDKIDRDLWEQRHLIWCQSLVDNLKPLYDKRKGVLPKKPSFEEFPTGKPSENDPIPIGNPQSIGEESIGKESIGDLYAGAPAREGDFDDGGVEAEIPNLQIVGQAFEQKVRKSKRSDWDILCRLCLHYPLPAILSAIDLTAQKGGESAAYTESILKNPPKRSGAPPGKSQPNLSDPSRYKKF